MDCNLVDPCLSEENVCLNGGVCIETCTSVVQYNCNCTDDFTGPNCSQVVNYLYYYLNSVYSALAYPFS